MDVSVITVTWNSAGKIAEQIRSVEKAFVKRTYEEFVVDNASSDGTAAMVERDFPLVKLMSQARNRGFGAANNEAARRAQGKYLLFLNPDMRLEAGSLDKICDWMDNRPKAGIVSCKLVNEKGQVNKDALPRRFPTLKDQLIILLKLHHFFPKLLNDYLFSDFNPEKEQMVDSVRGSFMLMRREVYQQLGWAFDPRYFIWFEDVDVCREVWRLDYAVMYTPIISAVDYVGQSFNQRPSVWKQKQFSASMLIYFKKWGPGYAAFMVAVARPIGIALVWLHSKFKK